MGSISGIAHYTLVIFCRESSSSSDEWRSVSMTLFKGDYFSVSKMLLFVKLWTPFHSITFQQIEITTLCLLSPKPVGASDTVIRMVTKKQSSGRELRKRCLKEVSAKLAPQTSPVQPLAMQPCRVLQRVKLCVLEDSDSAHALFVRSIYLVCHRLISSWKSDVNVSLAGLELLSGLARLNIAEQGSALNHCCSIPLCKCVAGCSPIPTPG
nr:uncharacterized protein LOC128700916 [Cherax quadricarinatus]